MFENVLNFIRDWYELYLLIGFVFAFIHHVKIRVEVRRNNSLIFSNKQKIRLVMHTLILISWVLFYPFKIITGLLVNLFA